MNKTIEVITGVLLLGFGAVALGNYLELWNLPLLFAGWWTLLLIVPYGIDLILNRIKKRNLTCLIVGVVWLLGLQGILFSRSDMNLLMPIGLLALGIVLLLER